MIPWRNWIARKVPDLEAASSSLAGIAIFEAISDKRTMVPLDPPLLPHEIAEFAIVGARYRNRFNMPPKSVPPLTETEN
jgi:hypothetical protein